MKVIITSEGLNLRRQLMNKHKRSLTSTNMNKTLNTHLKKLVHNYSLNEINHPIHISVNVPWIGISKDFKQKYAKHTKQTQSLQSNLDLTNELLSLNDKRLFIKNRISRTISNAKTTEEISKINQQLKRIIGIHNAQLKQRKWIYSNIKLTKIKCDEIKERELQRKLDEIAIKLEEAPLIDTRKKRKQERVANLCLNKYIEIWKRSKIAKLAVPGRSTKKFTELSSIEN